MAISCIILRKLAQPLRPLAPLLLCSLSWWRGSLSPWAWIIWLLSLCCRGGMNWCAAETVLFLKTCCEGSRSQDHEQKAQRKPLSVHEATARSHLALYPPLHIIRTNLCIRPGSSCSTFLFISSFLILKIISVSWQMLQIRKFLSINITGVLPWPRMHIHAFVLIIYTVMPVSPTIWLSFHDLNPAYLFASSPASILPTHSMNSLHLVSDWAAAGWCAGKFVC